MKTDIRANGRVYAVLFDLSDIDEGTHPVASETMSLQLLLMKRRKGHIVKKHAHKNIQKSSSHPMEAIVVIKGGIEAAFFDEKGAPVATQKVSAGQCLLIVEGGHEVTFAQDSLIYAFKDGPYVDDKINL